MMEYNLKEYLNEIKKYPTLSVEKEKELFKDVNNRESFLKILNCNLKLVVSIARKYFNIPCSLSKLDLIQEGNMGLITAIKKFNLNYNVRFVTFAYDWINLFIDRAIKNDGYIIRIPVARHDNYILYENTKDKLEKKLRRDMPKEDVYDFMNVSQSYINELERTETIKNTSSLNSMLGEDGELIYYVSTNEKDVLDILIEKEKEVEKTTLLKNIIYNSGLTEKQIKMILLKFGFFDDISKSYAEVGRILNITRQAVEQQIKKCLKIMMSSSYYSELKELDDNLDKIKKI